MDHDSHKYLSLCNCMLKIQVSQISPELTLYIFQDWEPVQHMMHDYKGMVSSWSNILGLHQSMEDKHKVSIPLHDIDKECQYKYSILRHSL